ncbi:MAG: prepilin-type N-terminal cleavage/methylation domain-containing protein [Bacilli bacterium]|nr:prepilin-type N-terminal cleavage/methylation domain-containing protein [Bacilli bacterium]MDD4734045.1 prepilin-type N-terminal cleavage/methylation domain-containing protein [Bacilli bacterium]
MNKKGFTLIELLSIIVILAVIALIATPRILDLIRNSQINSLIINENMLVKAAKTYVGANNNILPVNVGETKEISLSTLHTNNYISKIVSPYDKTKECNGYVIITKIEAEKYDYSPHLNCINNIGNSTDDGLVAHYKFNDFQEPTVNLVTLPFDFSSGYWKSASSSVINSKLLNFDESYTAWTFSGGGIARTGTPATLGSKYTTTWYIKAGTANTISVNWGGAHQGTKTTFKLNLETGVVSELNVIDGEYYEVHPVANGFWQISYSSTLISGTNYYPQISTVSGSVILGALQIEAKPYATPFVEGTRHGTVTDYSGQNKNVDLTLDFTPKWENGSYYFNGSNTYILLSNDIISTSNARLKGISYSIWIKPENIKEQRVLGQQISVGYSDYSNGGIGINNAGKPMMIAYSDLNPAAYIYARGSTTLKVNEWVHIAGVYDNNNSLLKIYVNGKLDSSPSAIGLFSRLHETTTNRIGKKEHANTYFYKGFLDEVRIYNRVLNDSEIWNIYSSEWGKFY